MMKSTDDVWSWLNNNGFEEYSEKFYDNQIDGETLSLLTERALEALIPVIGYRMKFLKLLETLKKDENGSKSKGKEAHTPNSTPPDSPVAEKECEIPEPDKQTRLKPRCKHSLASKRRQRLVRNKRKREEKKLLKRGLTVFIKELKQENKCLNTKVKVEMAIKEKYFEMWRVSEKEKSKLKTAKLVFSGCNRKVSNNSNLLEKSSEILNIDPSLLEDFEGAKELGKGRFGTVFLKKFRSSPVAVKYFESSTTAKLVEKEALYLRQCCHINLPIIYGMNIARKPFFIVSQFYGNESFEEVTLRSVINEVTEILISGPEHWLYIVTQLTDGLCYIHSKEILHNDIKNDNIVIVCNSSGLFSPVLIDFGKASLVSEARKKNLPNKEKERYYKEHYHIAPEIVEGTCAQSVKSDMYSVGVVIASIYKYNKYRPLKELAKHCLKPFPTRCTSSELLAIVLNLPVDKLC